MMVKVMDDLEIMVRVGYAYVKTYSLLPGAIYCIRHAQAN